MSSLTEMERLMDVFVQDAIDKGICEPKPEPPSLNSATVRFVEQPAGGLSVTIDCSGDDDSGAVRMATALMGGLLDLVSDADKLRMSMNWEMGSCKD